MSELDSAIVNLRAWLDCKTQIVYREDVRLVLEHVQPLDPLAVMSRVMEGPR